MTNATGTAKISETQPIAITGLPACPAWCRGDCVGGEVEHVAAGLTVQTDRLHERTLAEMVVSDADLTHDRDRIDLRMFIERLDSVEPDAPAPMVTRVVLNLHRHDRTGYGKHVALTSAELRHLAQTALEAADLLDAAKAAEGR